MKKTLLWVLALIMLVLPLFAFAEEENLISNGSFEELSLDGSPKGWTKNTYRDQVGYGSLSLSDERAHTGQRSVMIENIGSNDSRYITSVSVKPSTLYRLSCYVWVDEMSGGNGANLALEDFVCTSEALLEPTEGWQYLEWYGETGENQRSLTFGVRVGGYGKESTGRAWFDDVVLTEVDALPENVIADAWYQETVTIVDTEEEDEPSLTAAILWMLAGAVAFFAFYEFISQKNDSPLLVKKNGRMLVFFLMMAVGLTIRIILAVTCAGYEVDMNCFTAWSMRAASVSLSDFYQEGYFCDYPPAMILLLYPIGVLLNHFGTSQALIRLFVKLLPILTDLAGAALLMRWSEEKKQPAIGVLISSLYLLNPAVLITGSAWGQMDSILALLILITVYFAMKDRWEIALPVYVFSVLVKLQALLLGPIALGYFVMRCLRKKDERKKLLRSASFSLLYSIGVVIFVLLPFIVGREHAFSWLIELYGSTLNSYAYATVNTANLYELLGANWTALTEQASAAGEILLAIFTVAAAAFLWKSKQKKERRFAGLMLLEAVYLLICLIFRLNYACMGYGLLAFVYLFVLLCLYHDGQKEHLPFYLALVLSGLFVLSVKIHERYMFAAIPLYLLAYLHTKDKRLLVLCVGFSLTTYLNAAIVLNNSIVYGSSSGHLLDSTYLLNKLLSAANLGLIVYAGRIAIKGLKETEELDLADALPAEEVQKPYVPPVTTPVLGLRLPDYLIMLGVTAVYAVLCFTGLGSTVAPQTAFVSSSGEEAVVLELEESTEFSVLYYGGLSYNNFSIAVSDDGENWHDESYCRMEEGLCYRWQYCVSYTENDGEITFSTGSANTVKWFTGKYLRLTALEPALNLREIVARDRDGNNLTWHVAAHTGIASDSLALQYPAENLCDETSTCVGDPSWYNGTYFDEIYYARTAYEFLNGQAPYETSHPPLGKILMAASVAIFGMTPFGWRFAGAFIGTLMLPLMYLLAVQLTRKRSAGIAAIGAMALGLMHFTQTRLATIDTFPVFFIMLSYLFMIRYLQNDFFSTDPKVYRRGLISLLLCGISIGLAIASKWTGLYAALGLAILYFAHLIHCKRISLTHASEAAETEGRSFQRSFIHRRMLITCAFCVLFFVVLPASIYYVSYIPYFAYSGGVTLEKVVNAQVGMYNYHSTPGLGMDHPFYSAWWQWPLLMKPMWYAQDTFEPTGYQSTVMCFGNQWTVYLGGLAVLAVLIYLVYMLYTYNITTELTEDLRTPWLILIGFAVQFVPWTLVPRGTYIYHYFAAIPFLILATVWWITKLPKEKWRWVATGVYLAGALVFFGLYFPYASGLLTETTVMDTLKTLYASMKNIPGFSTYFNLWY